MAKQRKPLKILAGDIGGTKTRIPVQVILNDRAALMGAALYALHSLNPKRAGIVAGCTCI
jgi:glucokinase